MLNAVLYPARSSPASAIAADRASPSRFLIAPPSSFCLARMASAPERASLRVTSSCIRASRSTSTPLRAKDAAIVSGAERRSVTSIIAAMLPSEGLGDGRLFFGRKWLCSGP